jgi:hypothetical protein
MSRRASVHALVRTAVAPGDVTGVMHDAGVSSTQSSTSMILPKRYITPALAPLAQVSRSAPFQPWLKAKAFDYAAYITAPDPRESYRKLSELINNNRFGHFAVWVQCFVQRKQNH